MDSLLGDGHFLFKEDIIMYDIKAGRRFLWLANYGDIVDCEYIDGVWKRFDDINKAALVTFGLCSASNTVYFDANTGAFHLGAAKLEIIYGKYNLTNTGRCEDIIHYKSAHTNYKPNCITPVYDNEFAYGYKKKVTLEGINFSLKFIHCLPGDGPNSELFTIQITADQNLDAQLIIRQTHNGQISETTFQAPLRANRAGKINLAINSQQGG